ncbi:MAG TPA: zinc-dependent metalloprotease [Actinomycetota bacterium]|nr:zinc-dependent metalloprotease [Actinomycetota bacterium]
MAKLIEPRVASMVARRFANDPKDGAHLTERLRRDLAVAVPRAEQLVASASGIETPPPVRWDVITRARWAEANVTSLTTMLKPLADKVAVRLARLPLPVRIAQRTLVSVEVGVLLGYISRRVLGQYDILVPEGRRKGAAAPLYFVGINMVETERRLGFVPEDFALWVAVHEVTHRFQFAGVPWLRPHFLELVEGYLSSVEIDSRVLSQRLTTAAKRLISGKVPPDERNPIYLLASPEQRLAFDRIQALMAIVEGHGNFVMDAVGAQVIPSFARMRGAFDSRRQQASLVQRVLNNLIGLETKLRQYELGQAFCEHVARAHGAVAISHLWASPEHIPSLEELKAPDKWLSRVA